MIPVEGSMITSWGLYVHTCSRPYTVGHWFQIGKEVVEGIKKTSEFSHYYIGAALFDAIRCTSCLRFNWVVQQFEGRRCHTIRRLVNATLAVCYMSAEVLGICHRI